MRAFDLALPSFPDRERILHIELPRAFNVPRTLERTGLSGYESETLAACLASHDCAAEGAFFDIGANVGVFSWMVAAETDRKVVAFEPVPWLLDGARKVASANDLEIVCESVALSAESGTAEFYVSAKSDCSNSLRAGFRRAAETIQVDMESLDAYVERTRTWPAILKIDTESTEPDVISGAVGYLARRRPWIICEVLASRTEEALMEAMRPLGYSWYQITDGDRWNEQLEIEGDRSYKFVNWLFAPEPLDAKFWGCLARRRAQLRRCTPERGYVRAESYVDGFEAFGNEASGSWMSTATGSNSANLVNDGLNLVSELADDGRWFVFTGREQPAFDRPPALDTAWRLAPEQTYQVRVNLKRGGVGMPMQMWVLEYDESSQIAKHSIRMGEGENRLVFSTSSRASSGRLVFRVAGSGRARLEHLRTYERG